MATKRGRKTGASTKAKAAQKPGAGAQPSAKALQGVIQELMQAKQSGDARALEAAAAALTNFAKTRAPAQVQQAADEAQAVAKNPIMVDCLRQLDRIAKQLAAHA